MDCTKWSILSALYVQHPNWTHRGICRGTPTTEAVAVNNSLTHGAPEKDRADKHTLLVHIVLYRKCLDIWQPMVRAGGMNVAVCLMRLKNREHTYESGCSSYAAHDKSHHGGNPCPAPLCPTNPYVELGNVVVGVLSWPEGGVDMWDEHPRCARLGAVSTRFAALPTASWAATELRVSESSTKGLFMQCGGDCWGWCSLVACDSCCRLWGPCGLGTVVNLCQAFIYVVSFF